MCLCEGCSSSPPPLTPLPHPSRCSTSSKGADKKKTKGAATKPPAGASAGEAEDGASSAPSSAPPGSDAFQALQKQLNDENQVLPLQLLVTAHRRKFLLETIVGDPEADEREREELRRAEAKATATNNVYVISQVRRRQRQRETAKAIRGERLAALQAVVDRQKRREVSGAERQLSRVVRTHDTMLTRYLRHRY